MPIANLRTLAVQRTPLRELNLNMLLCAPVLALPMQEGSGDYAYDISGFGNHGHLGGGVEAQKPSWTQLPIDLWCLGFDGLDDFIDGGDDESLDITEAITIKVWLKPGRSGTEEAVIERDDGTNRNYFMNFNIFDKFSAGVFISGVPKYSISTMSLAVDTWYQLVMTYNGSSVDGFINGQAEGTPVAATGAIDNDDVSLSMGAREAGLDRHFKGLIALPRIYRNRALSATEILDSYNREKHYFDIFDDNILARLLKQRELVVVR